MIEISYSYIKLITRIKGQTRILIVLRAQNVTSAVNFLKEDPTFPISPTGISTQGLQQPPDHRIVNNSNIPVFK